MGRCVGWDAGGVVQPIEPHEHAVPHGPNHQGDHNQFEFRFSRVRTRQVNGHNDQSHECPDPRALAGSAEYAGEPADLKQ
jgi:hypothetical protein